MLTKNKAFIDESLRMERMKISLRIYIVVAMLAFAMGCTPALQHKDNVQVTGVAGTSWAGRDSDGDYYEYHFISDGSLHYRAPSGFWENGSWKQSGNSIYLEMNNKYSEYRGTILANQMQGNAWNKEGHRWEWFAGQINKDDYP